MDNGALDVQVKRSRMDHDSRLFGLEKLLICNDSKVSAGESDEEYIVRL